MKVHIVPLMWVGAASSATPAFEAIDLKLKYNLALSGVNLIFPYPVVNPELIRL